MRWCRYSHTCAPVDVTVELIVVDDFSLDDAFLILQTLLGQMSLQVKRLLDGSTCLRFRHCMEEHKLDGQILSTFDALLSQRGLLLKAGTVVDATLTAAPTFTKNKDKSRDPEMHFSMKGNQWYIIKGHPNGWGTKGHVGADAQSGVVRSVLGTASHAGYFAEGIALLRGLEAMALGDAGYHGIEERPDARPEVDWHIAMRPGKHCALNKQGQVTLIDQDKKLRPASGLRWSTRFGRPQTRPRPLQGRKVSRKRQKKMGLLAISRVGPLSEESVPHT